ncbi:MAG: hypothetical protein ACOCVF_03195 [bacterium]
MRNFSKLASVFFSVESEINMSRPNMGEKFMGNEASLKMDSSGKLVIGSGSLRFAMRKTFENVYKFDDSEIITDSLTAKKGVDHELDIEKNLRQDLFGDMNASKDKDKAFKRFSPIETTPVIARKRSEIFRNLCVNFSDDSDNDIIIENVSESDLMGYNTLIDVKKILRVKNVKFIEESLTMVDKYEDLGGDEKRKKRLLGYIKTIQHLNGFANQARNMIDLSPDRLIAVLFFEYPDKRFSNFFSVSETKRKNLIEELEARQKNGELLYFIGDDESNSDDTLTVFKTFEKIYDEINNLKIDVKKD